MKFIKKPSEIFLNENNSKNSLDLLKKIAANISDRIYCDKFGSCVHFAELFVLEVNKIDSNLLSLFFVIEGYVEWQHGDDIPQEHTWVELINGEKIDPTFEQFTKYGWAIYSNKISSRINGLEYYEETTKETWFSERRKKYPNQVYKTKK